MGLKFISFIVCAVLVLCDSAYVDTIKKCSSKDNKCVAQAFSITLSDFGMEGLKELHIPPFDPMDLSGLTIPVLGMLNFTVEEGTIRGIKDCVFKNVQDDFVAREKQLDLVCDLTIKVKVKFNDLSPVAQKLFGAEDVSGGGKLELKLTQVNINITLPYEIVKKDDGEIYFVLKKGDSKSDFDIGNLNMKAENLTIGKQDLTELLEKLVNENWKTLLPTFGNGIFNAAVAITKDILANFYNNVPTKYYYTDDFSSYV